MAELQKDRVTRGEFLGFGIMGTVMGAILTIPPAAYLLQPVIDIGILGNSDISEDWQEVGPVAEISVEEPMNYTVSFPINQIYGERQVQEAFPEDPRATEGFELKNSVWVSWRAPIESPPVQGNRAAVIGEPQKPAFLDDKTEGFTQEEIREVEENLNILSSSCAHLGCPVRWVITPDGVGEFLCPCHGGIYDINGDWYGGPPPRGMFRYSQYEVRENGRLYIKHGYEIDRGIPGLTETEPYVV